MVEVHAGDTPANEHPHSCLGGVHAKASTDQKSWQTRTLAFGTTLNPYARLGTRFRVEYMNTPNMLRNQATERSKEVHLQEESKEFVRTTKRIERIVKHRFQKVDQ